MKKKLLSGLSLILVFFLATSKMAAQDTDLTNLVVNSDFELVVDASCNVVTPDPVIANNTGDGWANGAWRPTATSCASLNRQFYGWTWVQGNGVEGFGTTGSYTMVSNSQGLNKDASPIETMHGNYLCWIGGGTYTLPAGIAQFSQVINGLSTGTYKVQCRLAVANNKRTSQRLFAKTGDNNIVVQYHGTEAQYASNQIAGETATFAGWGDGEKNLQEMEVTITVAADNDPLTIGIRTGSTKGDGTTAAGGAPFWGWFKVDYFRLTKLATSGLNDMNVQAATWSVDNGSLTVQGADAYQVYSINGVKIADAKASDSINLIPGVYIVKTNKAETFKVVVR